MKKRIVVLSLLVACCLVACGKTEVKRDEVFDAERFIKKADQLIDQGEYEEARKVLVEVKNRDTSKKLAPVAQLKIADTYIKDGDLDIGVAEYQRFLDLYPANQYASYAQYQIAMAFYSQIESPDRGAGTARRALKEFYRLKELYPRNPYREFVELRIEKCKTIIADGEFMVGEFYYKKNAFEAAAGRFEGLLKDYPDYKRADEALLLIGKSYIALKQPAKAKDALNLLIQKYPDSKAAADARKIAR
ncbi:MAG TPA: outer membrane protein assembly factor BamD [Dissulfurispiraceae bacterium]|nr:outer membrane protein assembly factor BamD [Dissulfurispiraceae bacterium]